MLSSITKAACYEQEKDAYLSKSKNLKQHQSQSAFTCSKLIIETLEQGVKYIQS